MRPAVGVLALLLAVAPAIGEEPSFQHLEESLTCQCGCGLTVHSCNHLQCPSAVPLRQEIREQMALGLDEEAILAHFSEKYGEKILSSPTAKGFNLTAWVTPFFLLAVGALFVVFTLLRWRRVPRAPVAARSEAGRSLPGTADRALEEVLERELKEFEG